LARAANNGGTVNFITQGSDLGTAANSQNQITFTAAPTLTGAAGQQILPYATVVGTGIYDFATVTSNNVLRFTNYNNGVPFSDINAPAANATLKITAGQLTTSSTLNASKTFNAILLVNDGITLGGAANTALTVGALAMTGASSAGDVISVPIMSMINETIITSDPATPNTLTINSLISSSQPLTLAGPGTVILPNVLPNNYTGGTFLTGGTLTLGPAPM